MKSSNTRIREMTKRQVRSYEAKITEFLRFSAETPYQLSVKLKLNTDEVKKILYGMRAKHLIHWRGDGEPVTRKAQNAIKDTSPFPRPFWNTIPVGFYDSWS